MGERSRDLEFSLFAPGKIRNFMSGPAVVIACLLYTTGAAADLLCVGLGGRRII